MTNNDVLRRIRYTFDLSDSSMIEVFASAEHEVTRSQCSDWLKKDDDPAFEDCSDETLAIFLNGFINARRGRKEGPLPTPEKRLNPNIILRKMKIALNLKAEGIQELLKLADWQMSNHELSALFRNPQHKNYRECKDQVLRKFFTGMQRKYRPPEPDDAVTKEQG